MKARSGPFVALAAGMAASGIVGGVPASAAASTLTVAFTDRSGLPHLTYPSDAPTYTGKVVISGGPVTNVRLEFTGDGVVADPAVIEVAGPTSSISFSTDAYSTGGFNNLAVTVTSDTTSQVSTVGPLLYADGGPAIPATGDLTGLAYGYTDRGTFEGGDGSTSYDYLFNFIDKDTALFGAPRRVLPRCKPDIHPDDGCVRYRYDKSTGLVVVGGYPGKVVGKNFWISRGNPDDDDDSYSSERMFTDRIAYPRAGKRFSGRWSGGEIRQFDWQPQYRLTLHRNGSFQLRITSPSGKHVNLVGRYRITETGRLLLIKRSGRRSAHLFAVDTKPNGTPQPKEGVWMTFRMTNEATTRHYREDVHLTRSSA